MVEVKRRTNDLKSLGCDCVVVLVLGAGEIGVDVLFHHDLVDVA